jgi:hypothetical protein
VNKSPEVGARAFQLASIKLKKSAGARRKNERENSESAVHERTKSKFALFPPFAAQY